MRSGPNSVTQCERGDSDPHVPFGTPDPKSTTWPLNNSVEHGASSTEPHGNDASRTIHVTGHVTRENVERSPALPWHPAIKSACPTDNASILNLLVEMHGHRVPASWHKLVPPNTPIEGASPFWWLWASGCVPV